MREPNPAGRALRHGRAGELGWRGSSRHRLYYARRAQHTQSTPRGGKIR